MRWLKIGLLITLLLLLIPLPLSAATTAEVTITATGYLVDAPGGFTVTYISDYEIGLSWTIGTGANNTMVRACFGREPEDRTDGYLVYYGNGTNATDWVNLEATSAKVHYRAWSETAGGAWEETGSTGWTEGVGMTFIGMVVLCAFLMIAGFWRKSQAMLWVAALAWVGFAFWQRGLTPEWATWDLHEIMFYVGFMMAIVCIVEAVMLYREEQPEPVKRAPPETPGESYQRKMADIRARARAFRRPR